MFLYSYRARTLAFVFTILSLFSFNSYAQWGASQPAEYKFPPQRYDEILSDRDTELWAEVVRPQVVLPHHKWPIVVLLHGNHWTCGHCQNPHQCGTQSNPRIDNSCEYTHTGSCSGNNIPVPNHQGYRHLTEELAKKGFFTVSINANLGINCGGGIAGDAGLNLARGRLILKHLEMLSNWNNNPNSTPSAIGIDLYDRLDFDHVGIFGHSRGGEGARAALAQYNDQGSIWPGRIGEVTFRSIFEIGPVDGQTSRQLNPDSVHWSVILPGCDGDVSNLQGIKPFDRILRLGEEKARFKSTLFVWGTNHNFYNSQWQSSDSPGCNGPHQLFQPGLTWGSLAQQSVATQTVLPFFQATNKRLPLPWAKRIFDPAIQSQAFNQLSQVTRVDRGYVTGANASMTRELDRFLVTVYPYWESAGITANGSTIPEHDYSLRAAKLTWTSAGSGNYFQTNFGVQLGGSQDLRHFDHLTFRVSRSSSGLNTAQSPTDFEIQLVDSAGQLSQPVRLSQFSDLIGPWNGRGTHGIHSILQSVRIPLNHFHPHFRRDVSGVRFTFNQTNSGEIYIADIEASRRFPVPGWWNNHHHHGGGHDDLGGQESFVVSQGPDPDQGLKIGLGIDNFQVVQESGETYYEITLSTATQFPVRDSLPTLWLGNEQVTLSYHPQGDTSKITFRATAQQLQGLNMVTTVRMVYGKNKRYDDPWTWNFL